MAFLTKGLKIILQDLREEESESIHFITRVESRVVTYLNKARHLV